MPSIQDGFLDLERHRQILEENVNKLRGALQQWQLWEAEYEALKEEVDTLPEPASREDLARIRRDFDGQLVTQKEVREIFGDSDLKPAAQIVNIVSRRIDYVSKNVATLEKQVEAAERKHEASQIIAEDVKDEESGLPFTDIIEELDDDDNVRSYRLQTPGSAAPQMLDALEKAGIKELPAGQQQPPKQDMPAPSTEDTPMDDNAPSQIKDDEPESDVEEVPRRGVSFAEDTKPGHDETATEPQKTKTTKRLVELMERAKEQEIASPDPVIPGNESAEDAELRREMLRYGMSDIAPIVAELELEEDTDEDDEGYDDFTEDEDDDEHGLNKNSVLNVDYLKRMQELEKKLGIKSSREIEQDASGVETVEEGIGRISVVQPPSPLPKSSMKPKNKSKSGDEKLPVPPSPRKGVRFAEALDVAPEKTLEGPAATAPIIEKTEPVVDPMRDVIVERSPAAPVAPTAPTTTKRPSKFKKARTVGPEESSIASTTQLPSQPKGPADAPSRFLDQDIRIAPSGPEGQTLASKLVERPTPSGVQEPDEFDATLLHQEAAAEYQRARNRMIQKDGGYLKENESPVVDMEDEETGQRMSRFKAARLARR